MAPIDPVIDLLDPAFSAGAVLDGRFVLRRAIGSGGSGEVWAAVNRATGGVVALKLVRRPTPLVAARFRREAELSAALAHRNVVRVFDYFEENGHLGLVMELLRGETARERLDRTGPLPPRAAVALVTQALAGLAHAHDRGVVHRDLKPPNLFLATDPDASTITKVLDFGIARTPSNTVHTLHGQLLGTPRYMSPEQIRAEPSLDGRSDLFSIAVVLYELVTGRAPFAAPFATASLALVLEKTVERDERIPEPLWQVIERALSTAPAGRPASAKAMADALREAAGADDGGLATELHRSRPPPPLRLEAEPGAPGAVALGRAPGERTRAMRAKGLRANAIVALVAASATLATLGAVRLGTQRAAEPRAASERPSAPEGAAPPTSSGGTLAASIDVPRAAPVLPSVPAGAEAGATARMNVHSTDPVAAPGPSAPAPRRLAPPRPPAEPGRSGIVKDPGF